MKTRYIFAAVATACMGLVSCSDFLTEDPKGQITPGNFFDSQANLDAAVNALYFNVQQSQCNSNPTIVQCQGDDLTSTTGSNKAAYLSADAFEVPSDSKGLQFLWKWQYNIIQAANLIIDNAGGTPVAQEDVNEALGQAYFWRAYSYFNLVRVFGPLPLNNHNTPDNNETVPSGIDVVYKQIVSDLEAALACNLPVKYSGARKSVGNMNIFITEQTVKATLGAVYMSMAGWDASKYFNSDEYYGKAADVLKEVVDGVNNGTYPQALNQNWADVYSYGNNYNPEIMLGIVYQDRTGGWSNQDSQLTSCHQLGSVSGWGDFLAEYKFWAQYPDGDRKDYVYAKQIRTATGEVVDWWATADGQPYNGKSGDESNAVVSDYRPMFVGFTLNADENNQPLAAPYDYTKPFWGGMCAPKTHQIIRYAEVLCWYAEAAGRSGKHIAEATAALKQVTDRAYRNSTVTPDLSDLAAAGLREHGWEVAGNTFSLVTRRADEFRTNTLKDAFAYRIGAQDVVLIPAGTVTASRRNVVDAEGNVTGTESFTYTTTADLKLKERMQVTGTWNEMGDAMMYQPYY